MTTLDLDTLPDTVLVLDGDRRLVAVVGTPEGPLTAVSTHLSFIPDWTPIQLERLVAELAELPRPAVLMGDLNEWYDPETNYDEFSWAVYEESGALDHRPGNDDGN